MWGWTAISRKLNFSGESFHVGSDTARATLSAGGEYCAAGTNDGKLFIWNVNSTQIENTIADRHNRSVSNT